MSKSIPRATHEGVLRIGNTEIACAVLEDGTRVITQYDFYRAIGRSGRPAKGRGSAFEKVAPFLALNNLKPFVAAELHASTRPVRFRPVKRGQAWGFKAEILPKVCEVYLKARDADALLASQQKFAAACDVIMRGLAHVGIIALVDEATGYQDVRARQALEKILEAFIADELLGWAKTFPDDFYRELFRLRRWPYYPPSVKRPALVGKLTNDIVYDRLAPGILAELRKKNPTGTKGRRRHRHHQWLTEDVGHPRLREHIAAIMALMRAATSWGRFHRSLERAFPKWNETGLLPFSDDQ